MKLNTTYYTATNLGQIIRSQGLRQDWIAHQAGISQAHLSRLIKGERMASEAVANRIAGVLRVDVFLAFDSPKGDEVQPVVSEAVPA